MSKSIPDRWLDYKPTGSIINGTPIMAFKVPLKTAIAKNLNQNEQFTINVLLKSIPNLKYVIDLTNTNRYYNPIEFTKAGIIYEKVKVPGHQIPPLHCIRSFMLKMKSCLRKCKRGEIIGVHCTHGVNRTGYLICRYLIEELGWDFQKALHAFSEARGYSIEREIYINDLKKLCHHSNRFMKPGYFKKPTLPAPPLPFRGPALPPRGEIMQRRVPIPPIPPPPPPRPLLSVRTPMLPHLRPAPLTPPLSRPMRFMGPPVNDYHSNFMGPPNPHSLPPPRRIPPPFTNPMVPRIPLPPRPRRTPPPFTNPMVPRIPQPPPLRPMPNESLDQEDNRFETFVPPKHERRVQDFTQDVYEENLARPNRVLWRS